MAGIFPSRSGRDRGNTRDFAPTRIPIWPGFQDLAPGPIPIRPGWGVSGSIPEIVLDFEIPIWPGSRKSGFGWLAFRMGESTPIPWHRGFLGIRFSRSSSTPYFGKSGEEDLEVDPILFSSSRLFRAAALLF
jgi:hypothetical protein